MKNHLILFTLFKQLKRKNVLSNLFTDYGKFFIKSDWKSIKVKSDTCKDTTGKCNVIQCTFPWKPNVKAEMIFKSTLLLIYFVCA